MKEKWFLWFIETVMVACAVLGSSALALNLDISKWGFIFFTVSSLSGIYVSWYKKINSMIVLNVYFSVINLVGVYRWLM